MVWLQYFMLFVAFQGLLISIILIYTTPPIKKTLNFLFSFLLVSISLYLLPKSIPEFPLNHPRLYLFSNIAIYFYTPIFYLLLNVLFNDFFKLAKKHLIYIFPVFIYLGLLIRYIIMSDAAIIDRLKWGNLTDLYLTDLLTFVLNVFLIYKSWRLFDRYKGQLVGNQKKGIIIFIVLIFISNLIWAVRIFNHLNLGFEIDLNLIHPAAHWVTMSFLILFLLIFYTIRSDFFTQYLLKTSYVNFQEDELELSKIKSVIIDILKNQKPYLDPEFSLTSLSNLSEIKKHKLSRFINHCMKTTFFDLINSYRIDEFLRLANLDAYKKISIIGIAYESGFNSKSTFYKVFKEMKGQSPKEYLKSTNSSYYLLK